MWITRDESGGKANIKVENTDGSSNHLSTSEKLVPSTYLCGVSNLQG